MGQALRKHASLFIAVVAVVTLAVTQVTAQTTEPAATGPSGNAHRVDGRHATGYVGSPETRKGKLVATNSSGFLPNNIIKKAQDANKLDGLDSSVFARKSALADYAKVSDLGSFLEASDIRFETRKATSPGGWAVLSVTAECGSGWARTGGGYETTNYVDGLVTMSAPNGNRGWRVEAENPSRSGNVTAFVVCMTWR